MRLALEAPKMWREDPLYRPHHHGISIIFAGSAESGDLRSSRIISKVANSSPAELLGPDVAKSYFGGIFRDADWSFVSKCTWNPEAGWGRG